MKKLLLFTLLFTFTFSFSQDKKYKRVTISNPSQNTLKQLGDSGIDLQCGAILKENKLQLELSENELEKISDKGIPYNVLIDDLTKFYSDRSEANLPMAISELNSQKHQSSVFGKFGKSSVSSILNDNIGQYNECDEIDWAVPTNFKLGSMGGCFTVSEALAELDLMRSLYPNLISAKTDASPSNQTTIEGRTTYYVRISDNPDIDESSEPETLYTGMTHSREVSSLMNLMYYMWYILENYDTDPAIKNLVDNQALYFIPIVNSDGLAYNESVAPNGGGLQRKNRNIYNGSCSTYAEGVDLNRNFGYYWNNGGSSSSTCNGTYRGPTHFSEPETQIIRDFFLQHDFELVLNHHSFKNAMLHGYAGVNPADLDAAGVDRREDEFAKYNHDMTHYNRYAYGPSTQISALNSGNTNDWMMGPAVAGPTGGPGAGKGAMAWTPENGSGSEAGSTGSGFWPNPIYIDDIAKRAMRANFLAAYYSGKYAKLIDLTNSDLNALTGNLNFGIEFLGQSASNFTLTVTPVSSNITSIVSPSTQSGMATLEQRNVSAAYTLDGSIQPNDEIEFKVTLSNSNYVLYEANITKYYNPSTIISDNPDSDALSNWTQSGGSWDTTNDAYSGSAAITDSPSGSYNNNESKTLQLNTTINTASLSQTIIQYYAKWDLERSFDYVQIEASNNGSSWTPLCTTYTKPGAPNANNTYSGKSSTSNNFQPDGEPLYDGDTQDKWVMEEIVIDASENSAFNNQSTVFLRFNFNTDSSNRQDSYTTTFDGFIFDDFKVIGIQIPCVLSVPSNIAVSPITTTGATITWDNIASATYDLRYKEISSSTWIDVNDLASATHNLTGLTASTDYEVQVRSKCGANDSAYSSSVNFTTTDVQLNYCNSASTNVNDEYIGRVQLNTIDNSSGAQFYTDFTSVSTTLTKDTQFTITVTPTWTGTVYNEGYSVWIDYNIDGDFDDAGEQVWTNARTNSTPVSGNFTIPSGAVEGSTRMRVSMKYNAIPTSCETFQYGEVEDYTVTIQGLVDTTAPVITLNGASTINLNVGDIYTEQGATATDDKDGDITASIITAGDTVDTNTAGAYIITYNVSDAAGNPATEVTRTVNVAEVPNGCTGGISSFPYTEGFENTLGAWTQSTADDINWTVDANGTPSNNTGPSSATQGSYYVFVEASTPNYPSKRAILNSPCFDLSGLAEATFGFKYHMYGSSDMGTIDLEISTDEGATWTSIWSQSGNKGNSWQTANVDVSAYTGGGIQLRFNRFVGGTWQADIAIDDVSMVEGGVVVTPCSGGITSFPYTEGFENTLGAWTQSASDDINWTIDANGTPSNNTGPGSAVQGSYYIFVEASGNGSGYPNKQAIINSPCYDLSGESSATFSFNYHMYGSSDMGTIALEASNDNGISWTSIWNESGNKGNSWQTANVDLSSYVGNSVQLRFNRITGGTWQADIALDNINLTTSSALAKSNLKDKLLDVDTNTVNTFMLYPNPVKGDVLNIKLSKGTNMSYKIINMLGQVVNTGKTTKEVMVNNLEAGMYYIEVNDGDVTMTKKFIKRN